MLFHWRATDEWMQHVEIFAYLHYEHGKFFFR